MAYLFHRLHEQSYIAHVMGFAACVGPYSQCERPVQDAVNSYHIEVLNQNGNSSASTLPISYKVLVLPLLVLLNHF